METLPSPQKQKLYNRLILLLVRVPIGIVACVTVMAAFGMVCVVTLIDGLTWGGIPDFALFSFVFGGMALMIFRPLYWRLIPALCFSAAGIAILALGAWQGVLVNSFRGELFEVRDVVILLIVGIITGILFGIGFRLVVEVSDGERLEYPMILSQSGWRLMVLPIKMMILLGLPFGLIGLGTADNLLLALAIAIAILGGLASGGVDLLCYIIARCVYSVKWGN